MGLLDGYPFDSRFYGDAGPPGGLLGMLIKNMPDLPMPQSGAGFPGQNLPPTDISAASIQPQAQPQQAPDQGLLGSIGSALGSLFSPSQANAGPMQQAPQGASPGLLDHLTSAWQGLGHGGLTSALGGLITGQRQDPQGVLERALVTNGASPDMARAAATNPQFLQMAAPTLLAAPQQHATMQALVNAGVPPAVAQAAALNPEILKTIAPQLYTKPQAMTTTDAFGGQHINIVNPEKGTAFEAVNPGGGNGAGSPTGSTTMDAIVGQLDQMRQAGASPDQMLQAIPQGYRPYIQGLLEGRALPASLGMKSSARQSIMNLAQAMGLDEGELHARQEFAKDFGNNKSGLGFRLEAGGKVLNHLEGVVDNAIRMHNKDVPSGLAGYLTPPQVISGINAVGNNPPEQRTIAQQLATEADSFSKEKGKFLSGISGGTAEERKKTSEAYDPNAPRSNLAGAAQGDLDLLRGQFGSMTARRDNVIGPNSDSKKFQIVTPEMAAQMERIQKKIETLRAGQGGEAQPKEAGTKVAPAEALSQAKDAIAKGASRDAVIKRLRDSGIEPKGL